MWWQVTVNLNECDSIKSRLLGQCLFILNTLYVFDFHWCMFIDRTFQEINFARVAARSRQNHDDHINYWYVGSSAHNKYVYHYNQKRVIHQSLFEIDNTIFYKSRVVQTQRIQWSSIQIIMQASNTEYHLLPAQRRVEY